MESKCDKCGNALPEGTDRCITCNPLSIADARPLGIGCLQWICGSAILAWLELHGLVALYNLGGLTADIVTLVVGVVAIVTLRRWLKRSGKSKQLQNLDAYLALSLFIAWFLLIQYMNDHGITHPGDGTDVM